MAAGWAVLISSELNGENLPLAAIGGLFFAVWSIYLFDRIYDSFRLPLTGATPRRHVFAKRHRPVLFILSLLSPATAGIFFVPQVDRALIKGALFPGFLCLLYFVVFRLIERSGRILFPAKELLIGFCFASGILVAASVRFLTPFGMLTGGALAALFSANCLIIGRAEREFDRQLDAASFFGRNDRGNWIPEALLAGSAFLSGAVCIEGLVPLIGYTVIVSCAFQLAFGKWVGKEGMQPLADGALLFPWVMLLVFR